MEILTLPLAILTVVYIFCGFMTGLFIIGLVCTIVGVIRMANHHDFTESGVYPVTKEAKKHKERVEKIKGKYVRR